MSLLPYLKTLAAQHLKALAVYKKSAENATVEFPALHRELFATEFTTLWFSSTQTDRITPPGQSDYDGLYLREMGVIHSQNLGNMKRQLLFC